MQPSLEERRFAEHMEERKGEYLTKDEALKPRALSMRYWPDAVLTKPCLPIAEVTAEIQSLAKNMIFTMMVHHGIGLAAPQVGHNLRLFVVDIDWIRGTQYANPLVFINPTLVPVTGFSVEEKEGCLSFPNTHAVVKRQAEVTIRAQGLNGEPFELECSGLMSRVVQHEYDHLNGLTINPFLGKMARHDLRKGLRRVR
jgi:peptide deformylase